MSNSRIRATDRVLATLLSFIMLIGFVPMTVMASTTNNLNAFTFTVKNGDNETISDATISYEIKVDGTTFKSGSKTTTNGEAVITDMSDCAVDVGAGKEVKIEYSVSKSGYQTMTGTKTVTDVEDNIDVVLTASAPETVSVSVTKSGDGTVKLNNTETNTVTVNKDSTVKLNLIPDTGCYISEVKINGTNETITDSSSFSKDIAASADTTVIVKFVREYTVTVSKNDGGSVKLNNSAIASPKKYDENSTVSVSVTPDTGYQIASVSFGGKAQTVTDVTAFSGSFTLIDDTTVSVSFVKVYTITVSYNANGTVVTDPACTGGKVMNTAALIRQWGRRD